MSASSSITRTEIVPLRMQWPTVLGTPADLVVFTHSGLRARRDGRRRWPPSAPSRMTPTDGGPCLTGASLERLSLPKPPTDGPIQPPMRTHLTWSPPSGRPASGGNYFVVLREPWCGSDGARTALSRCGPVARPEFSPERAAERVLPAGRRWGRQGEGQGAALSGPPPPPNRGPVAGDHRPVTEMKSRQASRKAQMQAIGCPLRMPPRCKDLI